MGMTLDESTLTWMSLDSEEALNKARASLMAHGWVAVKLVREPTSGAARKTLRQQFAKDRLRVAARGPKAVRLSRRGGRLWRHRQAGSALPGLQVGKTCVVPRDFNLLESLRSVRHFVAVAPVSS